MALAVRPTAQAVGDAALVRSQIAGLYQGLVAGLAYALAALIVFLCLGLWFGPQVVGERILEVLEHIGESPGPRCFWLGVLVTVVARVYYLIARWLLRLPWREMWGIEQ